MMGVVEFTAFVQVADLFDVCVLLQVRQYGSDISVWLALTDSLIIVAYLVPKSLLYLVTIPELWVRQLTPPRWAHTSTTCPVRL